jgi:hypothetical protein
MNTFSHTEYNVLEIPLWLQSMRGCVLMRKRCVNKGFIAIAFAVGLLVSCFGSSRFLIATLALTVILLGISYVKCR